MEEPCCICLEEITGGNAVLKCGHKVGLDCFIVMVSNDYDNDKTIQCPICRDVQFEIFNTMNVNINKIDKDHVESRINRVEEEIIGKFIPTLMSMFDGYDNFIEGDNVEGFYDAMGNYTSSLKTITGEFKDRIKNKIRRVIQAISEDSRDRDL